MAPSPSSGSTSQRLRLGSGLILFAYVLGHFLNHALGLVSVDLMEAVGVVWREVWESLPGTLALYGALVVHIALALYKTAMRRTWRLPWTEATQLALGLAIPIMLIDHIIGTRVIETLFGFDDRYPNVLVLMWPGLAQWQTILLLIVWTHAVIGLYLWLRIKPWFPRAFPYLIACAVLVPVIATAGWIGAARRLALEGDVTRDLSREAVQWATPVIFWGRWALIGVVAAVVLTSVLISLGLFDRKRIVVTYPGGRTVRSRPGQTVLEISRENGIPHASVCGGRARCSTCRTRFTEGLSGLPQPTHTEASVLRRIQAGPDVRLACQVRPQFNCHVQPLFPVANATRNISADDSYRWGTEQSIAVLFVDLRGFTALSEQRLPFDIVFILNAYLDTMSGLVAQNGGIVDKFIGDSVMALFGITTGPGAGARDALDAAASMMEAMAPLNARLKTQLAEDLRIGIGIHAGPVILGRIGVGDSAGGITALGDTVNIASRLEGCTKEFGSQLAVSDDVVQLAGANARSWDQRSVTVRGRTTPLSVYSVHNPLDVRAALAVSVPA